VPVLEQVLEKYPEDVKLAFKNFPLRQHKFAQQAAVAALAADKQGKFWEFHDLLFKHYNRLNQEKIQGIAQELKLDEAQFGTDMKDPTLQALISRDVSEGVRIGVRGTPAVFINGRQLRNPTVQGFAALIDKELGKKEKQAGQ